jgi:hypothetical protein
MDFTEFLPDGSTRDQKETFAKEPSFDCIYWYPTVYRYEDPASTDFSNPEPELAAARTQVARYARHCRVFAPFYRQTPLNMTRGANVDPQAAEKQRVLAYQDVEDSFKHYMAQYNKDRPFVLLGHSQGSGHLIRLLREQFDDNPALRRQLISALPIGGGLTVKKGDVVGGTFKNIPLCTDAKQVGCVIGYRSFAASQPPAGGGRRGPAPAEGTETACVNPAALGGGSAKFSGSYFPKTPSRFRGPDTRGGSPESFPDIKQPWARFPGFFKGECKRTESGEHYLEVDYVNAPGDKRQKIVDFGAVVGASIGMGTHVLDVDFALEDLLNIVKQQSEAMAKRHSEAGE